MTLTCTRTVSPISNGGTVFLLNDRWIRSSRFMTIPLLPSLHRCSHSPAHAQFHPTVVGPRRSGYGLAKDRDVSDTYGAGTPSAAIFGWPHDCPRPARRGLP